MGPGMLSYQHLYHAGNLADVHKHAVLASVLARMLLKDKPLSYLETHAGRGLYDLDAAEAQKTGEAARGIGRCRPWFAADHPYARVLDKVRRQYGASAYPGSPLIAALMLRPGDAIHLAELHPQEFAALRTAMAPLHAQVHPQDGAAMALSLTPPTPRRGLMLIDPSYEVKSDYAAMARLVTDVHRRWNVGVLMLWYPLLAGDPHLPMLATLADAGLPKTLRHEVRFPPAREGHRMTGSGLFLVNAPFGIEDELARLTARFAGL